MSYEIRETEYVENKSTKIKQYLVVEAESNRFVVSCFEKKNAEAIIKILQGDSI